ncbi:MAG TPA: glycosyltransferase family 1 protein [Gemmatimonadaceae bacterium]|nr:glycosyltransferase family 1 protein [Gemmatimonadaceae bacterium]
MSDASVRLHGVRLALFSDTYPPQMNGVSRTLERLVAAARERGAEVRIFTTSDPELQHHDADEIRWDSVPFWAYPQVRLAAPRVFAAKSALAAWRPSLVHVATEFGVGLAGRGAAVSLGTPLVTSYHTSFSAYAEFYRLGALASAGWKYFRWFHSAAARTFTPTEAIRDEVQSHGFRNVGVWGRGVDGDRFDPRHRSLEWRRSLGIADDAMVVLYVGRIAKEKGLEHALAAMTQLVAEAPSIRFVFVGDGPYEAELRAAAPSSVIFTGRLSGAPLSTAYASSDVFLFPSVTDTFGNVLLEAMASGLVVIAADAGNTRELVGDGRGVIVKVEQPEAIASALRALEGDRSHHGAIRERAQGWARERTWDRVWNGLFDEYRRVISARASSS